MKKTQRNSPAKARQVAAKRLKRKRKVEKKRNEERRLVASGRIIMFGNGNRIVRPGKAKAQAKPTNKKVATKELKPYRAVKITAQLDAIVQKIREMPNSHPNLPKLKARRDLLKKKLNLK